MPLREIEDKYTLSEITLMAWRSQEQGYQMRKKMSDAKSQSKRDIQRTKPELSAADSKVESLQLIADKFDKPLADVDGNFTLKHQSGEDAAKFLAAMGFPVSSIQ